MSKDKEITRANSIKSDKTEDAVMQWYDDFQDDYKNFLVKFYGWSGVGYGVRGEKDEITYVSPEQARSAMVSELKDPEAIDLAEKFVELMLKGGNNASSCYNVFYTNYKSKGAKLSNNKREFISSLDTITPEELSDKLSKSEQLSQISAEEWLEVGRRIASGETVDDVWISIVDSLTSQDRLLGQSLREKIQIRCHRPNDKDYCAILTKMIERQLRSLYEKYKEHLCETDKLKDKLETKKDDLYYPLVCDLGDYLRSIGSDLSQKVLFRGVKEASDPSIQSSNIQVAVDELRKPKYKPLLLALRRDRARALSAWKLKMKLQRRKLYPCYPTMKRDYKVPVGLTGLGCFSLSIDQNCVYVDIKKVGRLECKHSRYFHDLRIEKGKDRYDISFCHTSKRSRRVSKRINGVVKEIGVLKKGADFFVTLSYTITHPSENFDLARIFSTVSPSKEKLIEMPDEISVLAVDLNISDPVCVVGALIGKNINGPLKVFEYGRGKIIYNPQSLEPDGPACSEFIRIKQDSKFIREAIREWKSCQRKGKSISPKTMEKLKELSGENSLRYMVQCCVSSIGKRLRLAHKKIRHIGYRNLAEMIRLLDAMDHYSFMTDSYDRIHLKPGEMLSKVAKFDKRRQHYREFLTRRIAAAVCRSALTVNAKIVFVEDLDFVFDSDNDNNSLLRLMTAKTLLGYIEDALNKVGIAMVRVQKDGTSRTDPVTGRIGCRFDEDKGKLYVVRDGILGWVPADPAAALNVLLRGLNRSICPYKFYVKDPDATDEDKTDYGKRIDRFMKSRFRTSKVKALVDVDGKVVGWDRNSGSAGMCVYAHEPGNIVTEEAHAREVEQIKQRVISGETAVEFSLTDCGEQGYRNFLL